MGLIHSGREVDVLRTWHFKKYLEWSPFLVCFYIQRCVGFSRPIVLFELYVRTVTKAQMDFFVKENRNDIWSLIHHWKEENKIFPKKLLIALWNWLWYGKMVLNVSRVVCKNCYKSTNWFFCQRKPKFEENRNNIWSLIHRWKEENKIFPKSYYLPCETDRDMVKWPLMCQIACIFLKMIRSFEAPGLMIELRLPTTSNY